jgi:RNA polymerase sigma-70 factor (ECF subfamily)
MSTLLNSSGTNLLLQRVQRSDAQAEPELFARHRERLRKMVRLRLDRRLRGRFDSTSVLQLVDQDMRRRIAELQAGPPRAFFLWLRAITGERLQALHRQYLGQSTDAGQEMCLYRGAMPAAHSASLAAHLLGDRARNQAAVRANLLVRLEQALNGMDPLDREILALCHFEELNNDEAAAVLGLDPAAASHHYVHALKQLREILGSIPGFFENPR